MMSPGETDMLLEPLCTGQTVYLGNYPNSPIDTVRQILAQRLPTSPHEPRPIFCEMMQLGDLPDDDDNEYHWKESARWIKYEESVEAGGRRWSKPTVTLLTIPSILQLRNVLKRGLSILDSTAKSYAELIDHVIYDWVEMHREIARDAKLLREVLLAPKRHLIGAQFRDRELSTTSRLSEAQKIDVAENSDANYLTITSIQSLQAVSDHEQSDDELETPGRTVTFMKSDKNHDKSPRTKTLSGTTDKMKRKIKKDSEGALILVCKLTGICETVTAFVRLKSPISFVDMPEVHIPTRFLFIIAASASFNETDIEIVGRAMGALMVDEVFSPLAYRAREVSEIVGGIDEFLSQTVVIPSGKWSLEARMEPNPSLKSHGRRDVGRPLMRQMSMALTQNVHHMEPGLARTGRFFGGFIEDLKRKAPYYLSDFVDAFRVSSFTQCLAAAIFLFFTNITKIITFGGVMESMLHKKMASMENILSGGICGVIYALFAGQPLACLSATGPVLVFEKILYQFCEGQGWEDAFLPVRFWVGVWTALFLLVLVSIDASVIVSLITKFTEEAFATLISLIFIIQAFEELLHIVHYAPVTPKDELQDVINDSCLCNLTGANTSMAAKISHLSPLRIDENFTQDSCVEEYGGALQGRRCTFRPDVFPFCVVLFILTFLISYGLKHFRHSSYLPSKIRHTIADFNVLIAIVLMTALNWSVGLDVPILNVPTKFQPTIARSWVVNPLDIPYWWLSLVSFVPALFFTILVVMDQQITSVIVNRKENKLKKGFGYHLDLAVIAVLMVICSTLGIPYYVAATVISIMHVESLKTMTESAAPGEKPQFLGVREQRVTALVAHTLIGLAVFLTPVIRLVPVPVLLGIFLYTGVVALAGQEFMERLTLFFMPVKYQPDKKFLRLVPLRRVHLFTVIQFVSLGLLFAVKYTQQISMLFPVMLVVMVIVRKLMDRIFTPPELVALDDPLPTWKEMMTAHADGGSLPPVNLSPSPSEPNLGAMKKVSQIYNGIRRASLAALGDGEHHEQQSKLLLKPKNVETTIQEEDTRA